MDSISNKGLKWWIGECVAWAAFAGGVAAWILAALASNKISDYGPYLLVVLICSFVGLLGIAISRSASRS